MIQVADILSSIVSQMTLSIDVYAIGFVGDKYKLYTTKTYYLHTGSYVTLDGYEYRVSDFSRNEYIVLDDTNHEGETLPNPGIGTFTIRNPFFIHGKLKKTNEELMSKTTQAYKFMPLIWMFELLPRTRSEEVDSVIDSEGVVRLFFMNSAKKEDYSTSDHYEQIIKPIDLLVNKFIAELKSSPYIGKLGSVIRTNHANFTTGGGLTSAQEANILGFDNLSGIEVEIDLPIKKSMVCVERFIPDTDFGGFDNGFDTGFDID